MHIAPPTEDTVSEERQHDEVDGEHHATLHAALRFDAVIHNLVPVLTGQDLKGRKKHTANPPLSHRPLRDAAVGPEPVCPCSEGLSVQLLGKETLGSHELLCSVFSDMVRGVAPLNSNAEALSPHVEVILGSDEVMRVGSQDGINAFVRRDTTELGCALSLSPPCEEAVRRQLRVSQAESPHQGLRPWAPRP